VSIVTALLIGVRFPAGIREFLFLKISRPFLEPTKSPTQWVLGSSGVKWPGGEINQIPPSSADIKNDWSGTSTPLYKFVSCIGTIILFNIVTKEWAT
jgi:hypothetical protein